MSAGSYAIIGGMPDGADTATLTLRATYGATVVDRTIFVSKAKTGSQGNPGSTGGTGAPSIVMAVTRPSFMVLTYAEGTPVDPSFTGDDGQLYVMEGAVDVTTACVLSVVATGCAGSINTAENVPVPAHAMGYYRLTGLSSDSATLQLYAVYKGITFTTVVSVIRAKGGYEIVNTLPTSNLFEGRMVYLTTDGKLYRVFQGAWTAAVPALDITGTLTDAQIAGLDASKLLGQLTASQVLAMGQGSAINDDPNCLDITAWKPSTDGYGPLPIFGLTLQGMSNAASAAMSYPGVTCSMQNARMIPLDNTKTYRLSVSLYNEYADGACYARIWTPQGVITGLIEGVRPALDNSWWRYSGLFTSQMAGGTTVFQPYLILNYAGSTGQHFAKDIRVEEVIPGDLILAGTLTATNLAASSVTATQLAAGAVIAGKIAVGTIQALDIAAGSITGDRIQANSVNADRITAASITGDRLSAGNIITASAQINDGVIITAKIGDLQVNTAKIQDLTVGTQKITANAISTLVSVDRAAVDCVINNWTIVSATASMVHTGVLGSMPDMLCFGLINLASAPAGNIQFHMGIFYVDGNTGAAIASKIYNGLWTPGGSNWWGPQTFNHAFHDVLPDPGPRLVHAYAMVYTANYGVVVNNSTITLTEIRR